MGNANEGIRKHNERRRAEAKARLDAAVAAREAKAALPEGYASEVSEDTKAGDESVYDPAFQKWLDDGGNVESLLSGEEQLVPLGEFVVSDEGAQDQYTYSQGWFADQDMGEDEQYHLPPPFKTMQEFLAAAPPQYAQVEGPKPVLPFVPFGGGGVREEHGDRPRFELTVPIGVPFEEQMLTRFAVHMAKGAKKYSERNWEKFSDEAALERAKSGALRHMMQLINGVEDGEDHAAAVYFNVMVIEHVKRKLSRKQAW